MTNNDQRLTTNNEQRQTTTNDKQPPMTNNDQRQTTTNDKQRPTTNNDHHHNNNNNSDLYFLSRHLERKFAGCVIWIDKIYKRRIKFFLSALLGKVGVLFIKTKFDLLWALSSVTTQEPTPLSQNN